MAATMLKCYSRSVSKQAKQALPYISKRWRVIPAHYVLLPEVPPDTAETNALMRVHELPAFSKINPNKVITGCAKLAIEYDVDFDKHVKSLDALHSEDGFKSVFEKLECLRVPITYAWKTAKILSLVHKEDDYKLALNRINKQLNRVTRARYGEQIYKALQKLAQNQEALTDYQVRLIEAYITESKLSGVELDKDDMKALVKEVRELYHRLSHFRNKVMVSQNMFSHVINDFSQIKRLPKHVVTEMAEDRLRPSHGPWRVTLNSSILGPFLEYCDHRVLRENAWTAYRQRASLKSADHIGLTNHASISEIRENRIQIAKLLGCTNYAELLMPLKMAGTVDNALNLIESLKHKFYPVAKAEVLELEKFAQSIGLPDDLELWDLPYYRVLHKQSLYNLDEEKVSSYFTFDNTLLAMFKLFEDLFDVTFKETTGSPDTWHDTVRVFDVHEKSDDTYLATCYIDPYYREFKSNGWWCEVGREHSTLMGTEPISYVSFNLRQSSKPDMPTFMSVEEVAAMFSTFGNSLQEMLTTVPYSELSGQRNIEQDAMHVCGRVMSMLVYHPHVLKTISLHHQLHEPLSDSTILRIIQASKYMSAYDMVRELYLSAFDLEMHIQNEDAYYEVMRRLWPEYIPMPLLEEDVHPCSLSSVFIEQAANYYSHVWSEMLAADIYKTFDDAGLDNKEKAAAIGKRFRDTYLSLGGGVPAGQVFRRFQGRDPSPHAVIKYYGV